MNNRKLNSRLPIQGSREEKCMRKWQKIRRRKRENAILRNTNPRNRFRCTQNKEKSGNATKADTNSV